MTTASHPSATPGLGEGHTPLPWVAYDTGTKHKDRPIWHVGIDVGGVPQYSPVASWVWKEADAELIVRAVNAHDDMLAALQFIFDHIADKERGPGDLYPAFGLNGGRALEIVRDAIARATGAAP